jgi:hypothetical protein
LRAALVGVTAAIFGGQVWIDFVANGLPVQGLVLSDPDRIATPFFLTFFINFRGLDLRAAASPYLLAYDLLPPTFAAVALLAGGSCDAPGRRLVQLVYRTPALQACARTWHLPGPALIAPALVAWLLIRLRAASRPALA